MDPATYDWTGSPSILFNPNCKVCGRFTFRTENGWICKFCGSEEQFIGNVRKQATTSGLSIRSTNQQNQRQNDARPLLAKMLGRTEEQSFDPRTMKMNMAPSYFNAMPQQAPVLVARDANNHWEVFREAHPSPRELSFKPQQHVATSKPMHLDGNPRAHNKENFNGYAFQTPGNTRTTGVLPTKTVHALSGSNFSASGQSNQWQVDHVNSKRKIPFELTNLERYLDIFYDKTRPKRPTLKVPFETHNPQNVAVASPWSSQASPTETELMFFDLTSHFNRNSPAVPAPGNGNTHWGLRLPISNAREELPQNRDTAFRFPPERSLLNTPHEIPQPVRNQPSVNQPNDSNLWDNPLPLQQPVMPNDSNYWNNPLPLPRRSPSPVNTIFPSTMKTVAQNLFVNFQPSYFIRDVRQPEAYQLLMEEHLTNLAVNRVKQNPIAMAMDSWAETLTKCVKSSWISITILDMAYLASQTRLVSVYNQIVGETVYLKPLNFVFFGYGHPNNFKAFKFLVRKMKNHPPIPKEGVAFIHCWILFEKDEATMEMLKAYFEYNISHRSRYFRIADLILKLTTSFRTNLIERRDQGEFEALRTTTTLLHELISSL